MHRRIITIGVLLLLLLFAFVGTAFAAPEVVRDVQDLPPTNPTLPFSAIQFWTLLLGSLTPLVGYLINTYAPWVSEPVKAGIQVALAAVAAAVLQLLDAGDFAFNAQSLQLCFSAVISALVAHKFLWLPSGIGPKLGAGVNMNLASQR